MNPRSAVGRSERDKDSKNPHKDSFFNLLNFNFNKITLRIIINKNRNYQSNILYNSCTGFFESDIM